MAAHNRRIAEAKARFSEVIERTEFEGPQNIVRKGRKAAVIVAVEERERETEERGSLAQFFSASPLRGSGLRIGDRRAERES